MPFALLLFYRVLGILLWVLVLLMLWEKYRIVRGGTDGATLSYMGLPCPNLGTGGFNFHGPCECITAEKMDQCTEILLNLVDLYK